MDRANNGPPIREQEDLSDHQEDKKGLKRAEEDLPKTQELMSRIHE